MRNKIITIAVILIAIFYMPPGIHAEDIKSDKDLTQKIQKVIENIYTIKPGMTRSDLLKIFTTEGGLSNRTWQRYVYKECYFIKVDVEFKPVGNIENKFKEMPEDIIIKISQPYLESMILD